MSIYTGPTITNPVILYIVATDDMPDDIMDKYQESALNHSTKIYQGHPYVDSGFDLYHPYEDSIGASDKKMLNLGIRCAAFTHQGTYNSSNISGSENPIPKAFKLHTRSSIGRSNLRLANNVGIIDRGYRGEIKAIVDNIGNTSEIIQKGQRLFQICMPDLEPFIVKFCGRDKNALNQTERGSGGFGSTGH